MKKERKLAILVTLLVVTLFVSSCSSTGDIHQHYGMMRNNNEKSIPLNRSIENIKDAQETKMVEISNGTVFQLKAKPVVKEINGIKIRMYSYNRQIPGPLLKVKQGETIYVNFTDDLDMDTTIHWHGIRLENKYDGVVDANQPAIMPGKSALFKINFPDEGMYWYHAHMREDIQQELGLYGNIFVEPKEKNYFNPVDREIPIFLDDIKLSKNNVYPFNENTSTFTLMGRFGNVNLMNGETHFNLNISQGQIVRFYLTDSANTRTFNFSIKDHMLKLIGTDGGKFEKERMVDSVTIGPGERYIVEVLFNKEGIFPIEHRTPNEIYALGMIKVEKKDIVNQKSLTFSELRENEDIKSSVEKFKKYFASEPDYQFELTVNQEVMHGMEATSNQEPIEWEESGHMAMMNEMSDSHNIKWVIKDRKTGKENLDNNYKVNVGDVKKIRLFNNPNSVHSMQHPIHLHGQRFLVISKDGKENDNLAWKDTVLVPAGKTVDILVEFSNPGEWMMHCHIAEHLEAGMAVTFDVV